VYGAEGQVWSSLPFFHLPLLTLLDRGFYYVLPDVRGGGGRYSNRHREGIVLGRKNTAYDMIAVSEFLINEKYTSAGKIHLGGGSAGGLALGMAVNMQPGLFGSLVFSVPSLDVMLVNKSERDWLEEGNPNIKEELVNILDFSPYHNVKKQAYPAMMFSIGLKDENVHPAGTFKMVAKLKANQIGTAPIFMNTDFEANHFNVDRILRPHIFILAIHYGMLP
jgi:oligopeptidase B